MKRDEDTLPPAQPGKSTWEDRLHRTGYQGFAGSDTLAASSSMAFGLVTRTRAPGQELGITQRRPEFLTADHAHSTAFAADLDVY
jgi:hypothetical protein